MSEQAKVRDWEKLEGTLREYATWLSPKGVQGSDLDLVLHASSRGEDHFLIGEFKSAGQRLPDGQRYLLNALRKLDNFTVFAAWGPDKDGLFVLGMDWSGKVDKDGLAQLVSNWWQQAKGRA